MFIAHILLLLIAFCLPQVGYCQNDIQVETSRFEATFKPTLYYTIIGGGDSGGGGSGVYINGQLRLKDFAKCSNLRLNSESSTINGKVLAPSIFKFNAATVVSMIRGSAQVSDTLLEKIILAAAARANWYSVNASLKLDHDQDLKLAIFKRPIGIIMDQDLLAKLSGTDQRGLLFHESLRMVSLGFNIELSTSEIEEITCKAFSDQNIEIKKYPALAAYLQKLIGTESIEIQKFRKQMWETTFESISQLKDLQFIPSGGIKTFFYQLESSKFEALRMLSSNLSSSQLEKSFFGWAALEVPKNCTSLDECRYSEEWPLAPYKLSPLRRWVLILNDSSKMGWKNSETGLDFVVTKDDVPVENAEKVCQQISVLMKAQYSLLKSDFLKQFSMYKELALIINRHNLTTMENEELPILAKSGQSFLLWTPRSDLEQGNAVLSEDWNQFGRVMCIRQ